MESTFFFIIFTALLLSFCAGQEMKQQQVKAGDSVTMQWAFQIQGLDKVGRDGEAFIVRVALDGSVIIPADLKQSIQATVGPGMSGLTVTLLNVSTSQAGVYAFTRNGVAEPLQKQLLIVQVKPDKPNITTLAGPFVVGGEKTLVCNSKSNSQPSNHSLPLTFTWSVTPPGGRQKGRNYVITVPPQDRDKTFTFSCQAKEREVESEHSNPLSLTPQYGPLDLVVTSSPEASSQRKVTVKEGQPMNLTCSADCRPGCIVQWQDRRMTLVAGSHTYSVARTGRSHYGAYHCSVSNPFGTVEKNLTVDVQYEALVTSMMVNGQVMANREGSVTVAENSTVNFDLVVDSNPTPTAQRSMKDWGSEQYGVPTAIPLSGPEVQSLDEAQQHRYSGRWSIAKAACSDTKDYIMEARNTFQNNLGSQARVNLSVNCSPRPTTPPTENFGVALGAHQTVEVNITAFPRDLTFNLHSDSGHVWPPPQLKTHLLPEPWKMTVSFNVTIKNQTDYGTYKARFSNNHGDMNVTFSVRARGKPSPVEALTTTSVTSSAVTLTWKDGFDGGLRQTFSVDYRPHGSQEWKEAVASISGSPATVENLEAGIMYHFRVHSHNELGRSVSVEVEATTVSGDNSLPMIIGIVIGIAVLIAIVIVVVFLKLRNKSKDKREDVQVGLMENPGASPPGPSEDEYAEVKKPKKKKKDEESAAPLYGVVNKPKKNNHSDESAAPLYGVVNKPKKNNHADDVYENSEALRVAREKAVQNGDKTSPNGQGSELPDSRHMTDEGLIYMDVEICATAGNAGKKPRVKVKDTASSSSNNNSASKEADTEYVMIDFSKRAPVIPESDEEEDEKKKKGEK